MGGRRRAVTRAVERVVAAVTDRPEPKAPVVAGDPTRCPSCGSTEREPYNNTREHDFAGLDDHGRPYTHVVWRRTRCRACGQSRDDRFRENRLAV